MYKVRKECKECEESKECRLCGKTSRVRVDTSLLRVGCVQGIEPT